MRKNLSLNINSTIRLIYISIGVFLSALFIKILYSQIINSFFEEDLLWFVLRVVQDTEGLSGIKLIGYFLSPSPVWLLIVWQKVYTFFILSLFGPLVKNFIFVSILFHFGCSILLFLVSKKLNLSSRISFFTALMYFTLFAHYRAYMWPMAFMHLIIVFFILLTLNFYLKTDSLISRGQNYRGFFILTLLISIFASFCRLTILILPAMVITHILFCSKDNEERVRKFDIWLPLFIIFLIYPLVIIAAGDLRLRALFRPLVNSVIAPDMLMDKINMPIRFSILFLLGLSVLFTFRIMLAIYQRYNLRRVFKWIVAGAAVALAILLIAFGGPKRLLIPYNFTAPFIGILASFMHPLQNALLIDSARPYHYIPLQLDVFNFILGLLIIFIFIRKFIFKNKSLIILGVWYAVSIGYLYLRNPLVSRYFIYLSPVFCIIFCAVLDYSIKLTKFKIITKEIILSFIFVALCIPNLMAIKLALFKGKMVNNFITYDYIRAANLIKQDFLKQDNIEQGKAKNIYLKNVMPVVFTERVELSASDPHNDNLRFVFMQAFNNASINIKSNQAPEEDKAFAAYSFDGDRVLNGQGVNISPFSQLFDEAIGQLRRNRHKEAMELFIKAQEERPFLLNYVLSDFRLDDKGWITNGSDLRSWINEIICFYNANFGSEELERIGYVSTITNKEIDDYIQCLFYIAYLKHISGNAEESKYWFAKIGFLESDYNRLSSWLSQVSLIKSDSRMLSFLNKLDNTSLYTRYYDYANRYKFERFMFGLIFKI
ncbi:MAG: hypothetical protein JSV30_06965 [Candidatus Omnitrophota bacterium]|nr:MAG: hypothetical protein JSV30_06965 [Candidatus Omnitrophota bacterium]